MKLSLLKGRPFTIFHQQGGIGIYKGVQLGTKKVVRHVDNDVGSMFLVRTFRTNKCVMVLFLQLFSFWNVEYNPRMKRKTLVIYYTSETLTVANTKSTSKLFLLNLFSNIH